MAEAPAIPIFCYAHAGNTGGYAAPHTGIQKVVSDYVIIQAKNLEYDLVRYALLLRSVVREFAKTVLGSRFISGILRKAIPLCIVLAIIDATIYRF